MRPRPWPTAAPEAAECCSSAARPSTCRALRDGLAPLPPADPGIRAALAAEAERHGPESLHARLEALDPAAAARIHPRDSKRTIRALEVAEVTGRPLSAAFAPAADPVFERRLMVVDVPRATLYRRIDERVQRMFSTGLVEETRAALATPGGIGPTARQAAGYAESMALLDGQIDLAEAIRRTQQRTRQLAKRQLTWLRSFAAATWITG